MCVLLDGGGRVGLKLIMRLRFFAHLKVFDVGAVLLSRVVLLTALAQCLVVDRQRDRLHVHDLVVGDGGLERVFFQRSQLKPAQAGFRFSGCVSAFICFY